MTAGCAASRRVLARTPVAPLPASSPKRPTDINGRTSAPPEMYLPDVCSFQLPKVCSFRLPLTPSVQRTTSALALSAFRGLPSDVTWYRLAPHDRGRSSEPTYCGSVARHRRTHGGARRPRNGCAVSGFGPSDLPKRRRSSRRPLRPCLADGYRRPRRARSRACGGPIPTGGSIRNWDPRVSHPKRLLLSESPCVGRPTGYRGTAFSGTGQLAGGPGVPRRTQNRGRQTGFPPV